MRTVNHKDIMKLGFSKTASKEIIRQAKFNEYMNSSNNMINLRRSPFDNKRLDLAPSFIVEELLGFQFT